MGAHLPRVKRPRGLRRRSRTQAADLNGPLRHAAAYRAGDRPRRGTDSSPAGANRTSLRGEAIDCAAASSADAPSRAVPHFPPSRLPAPRPNRNNRRP
jgi:hypothetical protein